MSKQSFYSVPYVSQRKLPQVYHGKNPGGRERPETFPHPGFIGQTQLARASLQRKTGGLELLMNATRIRKAGAKQAWERRVLYTRPTRSSCWELSAFRVLP